MTDTQGLFFIMEAFENMMRLKNEKNLWKRMYQQNISEKNTLIKLGLTKLKPVPISAITFLDIFFYPYTLLFSMLQFKSLRKHFLRRKLIQEDSLGTFLSVALGK